MTNTLRTVCAIAGCEAPATVTIARRTGTVETCLSHESQGWELVPATVAPVTVCQACGSRTGHWRTGEVRIRPDINGAPAVCDRCADESATAVPATLAAAIESGHMMIVHVR